MNDADPTSPASTPLAVYGLAQCDTVRKARAWLQARGLSPDFHDFRKQGVPPARLPVWLAQVGADRLVNRQGTTWRRLDEAGRAQASGEGLAALLLAQGSLIRRPVVEWSDGAVTAGFDEAAWAARLAG